MIKIPALAQKSALRLATCSFAHQQPDRLAVILDSGRAIDVQGETIRQHVQSVFRPDSMISLIEAGEKGLSQLREICKNHDSKLTLAPEQITYRSPIPKPVRNIFCVGWNYLEHFEEGKQARADKGVNTLPEHPVFFTKATTTMNGPFDSIAYDANYTSEADWEAELAVVIAKTGVNISERNAWEYVFGYSAYNDTTVRDVQQKLHGGQWFKGKSTDGYGPMGPWIVTQEGVNLDTTRIICRVNGVEKQNAAYSQMFFKIPRILAELSRGLTLQAGDIIATGTPPGVGYSRTPPEFLKPGDQMETEITGIGSFINKMSG